MSTAQKGARPSVQRKKRHGHHHTKGRNYIKVYWPYMPLLLIIVLGSLLMLLPQSQWDVLAYASSLSRESLLKETNEERIHNGRTPLKINEKLNTAAQAKANDMAARNYWSHNTPDGQEPWVFVAQAGYDYKKAGENLAYGFRNSDATVTGWMNSQTHRDNLLDIAFTEVGFGYSNAGNFQDKGEVTIVVAMYGNPLEGQAPVTPAISNNQTGAGPSLGSAAPAEVKPVTVLQSASPRFAWLSFAIGLLSGLSIAVLIVKHGIALRKLVLQGEAYFMHHPVFDIVLLSMAVVGLLLTRTAGFII